MNETTVRAEANLGGTGMNTVGRTSQRLTRRMMAMPLVLAGTVVWFVMATVGPARTHGPRLPDGSSVDERVSEGGVGDGILEVHGCGC